MLCFSGSCLHQIVGPSAEVNRERLWGTLTYRAWCSSLLTRWMSVSNNMNCRVYSADMESSSPAANEWIHCCCVYLSRLFQVTSYSLALREIDTVQDEDTGLPDGGYVPNALEVVLRKRHLGLLSEPLLTTLLAHKWEAFARTQVIHLLRPVVCYLGLRVCHFGIMVCHYCVILVLLRSAATIVNHCQWPSATYMISLLLAMFALLSGLYDKCLVFLTCVCG